MKVLFVTNIPSPYRMAFFNELGKMCELTVAFEGKSAAGRDSAWKGNAAVSFSEIYMDGMRVKEDQFFCSQIISVLRNHYDVIILGGYTSPTMMLAIAWMKLKRIPYYIEVDGGLIRKDGKAKYCLKKLLLGSADGWFSTGQHTTDYLVHYGAKRERVFLYPFTSLDRGDILTQLPLTEEKEKYRYELGMESEKVVLAVGQFIYRKGFDVLLQAASALPTNVGVYIVGGEPTDEYAKMCQDLNLSNVYFHGFQSKASLAKYYQAADIFVLPTREDIWGLVINEAMAYGLPVVTTDRCIAGLELVENGVNGYIVPVDHVQALAEAIGKTFSANPNVLGLNSLTRIQPYTIENMARAHYDVFVGAKPE